MKSAKRFLSILLTLSMVLGLLPMSAFAAKNNTPFTDVSTGDWFYESVEYVYECGMMSGTGETTFSPQTTTTRGMIVTILHRMEGTPEAAGVAFNDVDEFAYYADAVSWASENGIVGGYGNGKFGPNDPITREQMAAILYRFAQYLGMDVSVGEDTNILPYGDAEQVSEWAVEALQWAVGMGLINGIDGKLVPQGSATRAQVATILMRFCEGAVVAEDTHTVTFQYNYGSKGVYQEIQIADGDVVDKPDNPGRKNHTFKGWYTAKSGGVKYNFNLPVTEDIILWAKWKSNDVYYTVTFDSMGGSEVESQEVEKGAIATKPETPTMDGYSFAGWYMDSELTTAYDFANPVTGDITLYAAWNIAGSNDNLTDDIIDLGDIVNKETNGEIEVIYNDDGTVAVIDGPFTDKKVQSAEDAADLLNSAAPLFGNSFDAEPDQFTEDSVGTTDDDEENFYRYHSNLNGIPVIGSQIVLSTKADGSVTGLFTTYQDALNDVDSLATITAEEAESVALDTLLAEDEMISYLESVPEYSSDAEGVTQALIDSLFIESQLAIYAADNEESPVLVYAVSVSTSVYEEGADEEDEEEIERIHSTIPEVGYTFYIYANEVFAGQVYLMIDESVALDFVWKETVFQGQDLNGNLINLNGQKKNDNLRLKDTTRNITTFNEDTIAKATSFDSAIKWVRATVSTHNNMAKTFDYYKNMFGRDSYNGKGKAIKVYYKETYDNASWDTFSKVFTIGGGSNRTRAASLDTFGHEYTHAVAESIIVGGLLNRGLNYSGESGALDEAYADIMGGFVEGKTGSGFWTQGEDGGKILRDKSDPEGTGYPSHYSDLTDPYWDMLLEQYPNRDNEGVHFFQSIYCYAFYKMVTDSRTNTITQNEWATVFYRSLYRLTTDAKFINGRGAVIAAAKQAGFNHEEQQAIKDAFDAVGICEPDSVKIILTWNETPSDLDSHLVGPDVFTGRFHIYYGNRDYFVDGSNSASKAKYVADLDYDDTTSYGPEVTTIHILTDGEYYFYVHDFSNGESSTSKEMANSGALVTVYWGADGQLQASFDVDTSSQGTYWNVFKLTVKNSQIESIEGINTYGSSATYS